jgi:SEL1 protein
MYLSGFGVEKNAQEAVKELLKAAERGSMEAQFHLGALHVRGVAPLARDYTKANTYFGLAAAQGHSLASYNLAMMQLGGLGAPIACAPALDKLKLLAERSSTVINLMENAREHFVRRNYKESLYAYAKASEMGVELAQANAAYILERNFGGVQNHLAKEKRKRFSPYFHELAADQGNVLSLLTIGDAHYAGWISSSISSEKDDDSEETLMVTDEDGYVLVPSNANSDSNYEKAAQVYRRAAGLRSAAAMFNLGRMHEVGRGVAKDYHLAKRFYDSTLSAEPDAKFIVKFALWGLRFREWVDEKDWKNKDYRTIVSDIFRELLLLRPGIFNSNIMSVGEDEPKSAKIVISTEKKNPPPSSAASGSATEHIVKETNKVIEWGKKNSDVMLVIALGIFLVITLGVRSILAARHHHHRD